MVLILYTLSDAALFNEKILHGIKVIEQTRFSLEKKNQMGILSQKL